MRPHIVVLLGYWSRTFGLTFKRCYGIGAGHEASHCSIVRV